MITGIKAVLLDLNRVGEDYEQFEQNFSEIECPTLIKIAEHFGKSVSIEAAEIILAKYRHISEETPLVFYPVFWQSAVEEIINRTLSFAEIEDVYEQFLERYASKTKLFSDFKMLIEQLSENGFLVGVVSNGYGRRVYRFLELQGLRKFLNVIIPSGLTPFKKPDPEIFQFAITRLGIAPVECLFVGDRIDTDIEGANGCGIWSALLDRGGSAGLPAESQRQPDFSVGSLEPIYEIAESLKNLVLVDSAVLLCGGEGSRMGELTSTKQKCMLDYNGTPILKQAVDRLSSVGIRKFYFVVGYRSSDISDYFGAGDGELEFYYLRSPSGSTGESIASLREQIPDHFIYQHGNIILPKAMISKVIKEFAVKKTSTFAVTTDQIAPTHPVFSVHEGQDTRVFKHKLRLNENTDSLSIGLSVISKSEISLDNTEEKTMEELFDGKISSDCLISFHGTRWKHFEVPSDLEL